MTITVDAWGGIFTDWALTWTYQGSQQPATSAGGGQGGHGRKGRGRRYEYLNVIDDAHLLPIYQQRQRQLEAERLEKLPRRRREPEEEIDENDPDILRMQQYLDSLKR